MIFWLAGTVGQLFSGFLQAAAYTNLHGVHGYAGCKSCHTHGMHHELRTKLGYL
jgi:hypothetical protein